MSKTLLKSTSTVSGMTTISRIFGFVREMVTAQVFGAGVEYDAFTVAFRIPNFMRRLFAEGSFSQAFVPVLSEYQKQKSPEEIKDFINSIAGTLGIVLLVITILGVVFAPAIVRLFAFGFDTQGPRYELTVTMLRITFPYLMLISLTAFSGAVLNTYSRYWVAAFTPILLNIAMIVAAIWLAPHLAVPITALAWGVFVAGIAQLVFQWPFLKNLQLAPRPKIDFHNTGVTRVLKLMVPALFGVSVYQINVLIDTLFASFLVVGSVSWLSYSDRLLEFPLGVFGVAIATVILPYLSRHHASQSEHDFSHTIDWALRCVLLVSIPAAIVFAILSGPLLSTLFQHGEFNAYDVVMTSKSLSMFAIGITPFMLVKILAAGFYAKQDMKTPVRIGIAAMFANMVLNCIFILPLKHAGIALATSMSAVVNAGFLFYYLRKNGLYQPREGWYYFTCRLLFANTLLGICLWFGAGSLQEWVTHPCLWRVAHFFVLAIASAVIYFAGLWLAGVRPRDLLIPQKAVISS